MSNFIQQIQDWNAAYSAPRTYTAAPPATIHEAVLRNVAAYPTATALLYGDGARITYQALGEKSSRLASRLAALNPSVVVGVLLPRGAALPVAQLAVLRADCTYCAFNADLSASEDPDALWRSVQQKLASVQCSTMVMGAALFTAIQRTDAASAFTVCVIDTETADIVRVVPATKTSSAPVPRFHQGNQHAPLTKSCMYVEFTSGTTGAPKPVGVSHASVLSYVTQSQGVFGWSTHTRSVLCHSVAFDLHVHDLWGPWVAGGAVIAVPAAFSDIEATRRAAVDHRATHVSLTPHGFHLLTELEKMSAATSATHKLVASLRHVMLCGDALDARILQYWFYDDLERPRSSPAVIHNCYGITETTVVNTVYRVRAEDVQSDAANGPSRIGLCLPHTVALLLNPETLEPVAHGDVGEMFLAGDCVSLGYLSCEDNVTSASNFTPIPASLQAYAAQDAPTNLMYRTGDLASFDVAQKCFLFHGRCNTLVKVRGYRVSAAEVEGCIQRLPFVKDCAVIPVQRRVDAGVTAELVAFIVPRQSTPVDAGSVRNALLSAPIALEAFKIPTTKFIDCVSFAFGLPRNTSNKTDRAALLTKARSIVPGAVPAVATSAAPEANDKSENVFSLWMNEYSDRCKHTTTVDGKMATATSQRWYALVTDIYEHTAKPQAIREAEVLPLMNQQSPINGTKSIPTRAFRTQSDDTAAPSTPTVGLIATASVPFPPPACAVTPATGAVRDWAKEANEDLDMFAF